MRAYLFFGLSLLLAACSGSPSAPGADRAPILAGATHSDSSWLPAFRAFRDAAYSGNLAQLETFIQLPMPEADNEVWALVKEGDAPGHSFTQSDLRRYRQKLFPSAFIKALLKVKSEELYRSGHYETPFVKEGRGRYQIYADVQPGSHELTLNLYSETPLEGEEANAEFSIIYIFALHSGHLQLQRVRLAG